MRSPDFHLVFCDDKLGIEAKVPDPWIMNITQEGKGNPDLDLEDYIVRDSLAGMCKVVISEYRALTVAG